MYLVVMLQDVKLACLTVYRAGVVMQRHNEDKLNEAFAQKCGVYLIFSVNMSGHFQGYARMMSYVSRQQVSSTHQGEVHHHVAILSLAGSGCSRAGHLQV